MTADGSNHGQGQAVPFGPFWLERRLAVGSSAEVYVARPRRGDRPAPRLVVKRIAGRCEQDEGLRMLSREAKLNQAVRHPNVVKVYGAGEVDGEAYLALEYVEGVDLYRLLRRAETEQRRVPIELAVYLTCGIAQALTAVHSATDTNGAPLGLVHRDVTPSNVYLSNGGAIKLGDFGIARVTESKIRSAHQTIGLKGKFGYLAPEQIAGEPFDYHADLFALAVILGEMLIGERVFPGSGQLAVLLAIRDGNIEPLRRHEKELPPELFLLCLRGLAREPLARYQSAQEFLDALRPHQHEPSEELQRTLAQWVTWAEDSSQLSHSLQGKIRDSVEKMRAVRLLQNSTNPPREMRRATPEGTSLSPLRAMGSDCYPEVTVSEVPSTEEPGDLAGPAAEPFAERLFARVRFASGQVMGPVGFPQLIEMITTGELRQNDEVAWPTSDFCPIADIEPLARHLSPSTSATTSPLYALGVPDYQATLLATSMLDIVAKLRNNAETGVLFVDRHDHKELGHRKEIYVREGRLLHVATSERDELLGEYLIRRGVLSRPELEGALEQLATKRGRLGDTLVTLGLADAVDVFRAIRDLGRDRVAAICGWDDGAVMFYRGTAPHHVEFPLDLDLSSPMMAGAFVLSKGNPRTLLPSDEAPVVPGSRAPAMSSRRERGTAPLALLLAQRLATRGMTVGQCLREIVAARPAQGGRSINHLEACAALVVAHFLGWIDC